MKITGTRSYIQIEIDGKVVKVEGEMLIGGFAAEKDSMKHWEPPYEKEWLSEKEKQDIMEQVTETTKGSHMVITFE